AAAPKQWDYIHLSGRIKNPVLSIAALPGGRHLIRHVRVPLNMGGYLISRSGAEKMLAPAPRIRPIDLDIHFSWERGLDVLGVHPAPVIHDGQHMPSTITDRAKHKRSPRAGVLSRLYGAIYAASK